MLAIILFILKLLGILIFVLLGLILFVLFLVLFAPVKYSSNGSKCSNELKVNALITYLNPIVRLEVHYPDDVIVSAKVLGVTIYQKSKENNTSSERVQKGTTSPKLQDSEQKTDTSAAEKKKTKKTSTIDTISTYATLFYENKELFLEVLKVILKALKTILPRKCYVKAIFGTGQADTTGFIYAAYSSLRDYLPGEVILEPVWIESYLEGEYLLKGKVRMIHFVTATVKIIANRDVRLLYKKIRSVM